MKKELKEELLGHCWFLLKVIFWFLMACIIILDLGYFGLFPGISDDPAKFGSLELDPQLLDSLMNK